MILLLARHNIKQNPFRNILTGLVLLLSVSLAILGQGLVMGIDESIIRGYTKSSTGDFVLETTDSRPLSLPTLSDSLLWTDRLIVEATIIEDDIHIPISLIGYNKDRREKIFSTEDWLTSGTWPRQESDIAAGHQLYSMLANRLNTTIAVQHPELGMYGQSYTISGVIQTNNPSLDSRSVWIPNEVLSKLLHTQDKRNQILFKESPPTNVPKGWRLSSAYDKAASMLSINTVRKKVLTALYMVILSMAIIGLISTTLVNMDERNKELALLRSLGMNKRSITKMMITEQILLSTIFVIAGACISGSINYYFSEYGIDLSNQSQALGSISVSLLLYTQFSWIWILLSIIGTILLSVFPPLFFVWRSSSVQPIELFGKQI